MGYEAMGYEAGGYEAVGYETMGCHHAFNRIVVFDGIGLQHSNDARSNRQHSS